MASRRSNGSGSGNGSPARQAYDSARRARLGGIQRARILSAAFEVACERGAGSVTVAHVVDRSGVSRRTFYEQFADREDCLLAAFENAVSYAAKRAVPAYGSGTGWRERIRMGVVALLAFFDEQPRLGRFLVVESLSAGPKVLERRGEIVGVLTGVVDEGRALAKTQTPLPLTAEGVVGGALTVLHSRIVGGDDTSLIDLAGPVMSMIVLPYLGAASARRELERPVPKITVKVVQDGPLQADPFKEAGLRLTYRTLRVLLAVAEHEGGSNRQVGETAGITDQGQISKLLARLKRIELISNTGAEAGKGMPNAWSLTEKGRRVTESVRAHTSGEQLTSRETRS